MVNSFYDRVEAGRDLAARLKHYAHWPDVIVLGLPRGGVEVAAEVALELHAPLDVFVVRKLGVPGRPELAMGAIASGSIGVLNANVINTLDISEDTIAAVSQKEKLEVERRERLYRNGRPPLVIRHRTVILVDDGLATGATMRAAVAALRQQHPTRIVMAVPLAAPEVCAELEKEVDEAVCSRTPEPFMAVGLWYRHFPQLTDEEVRDLLQEVDAEFHETTTHGDNKS